MDHKIELRPNKDGAVYLIFPDGSEIKVVCTSEHTAKITGDKVTFGVSIPADEIGEIIVICDSKIFPDKEKSE